MSDQQGTDPARSWEIVLSFVLVFILLAAGECRARERGVAANKKLDAIMERLGIQEEK